MVLGKDAHQMKLDLLFNRYVVNLHYVINNNTTVLVEANELNSSVFLTGFNGIVWF